jgi:hypothetical protein
MPAEIGREVDDVREQHRGLLETIGDHSLVPLQPHRHRLGQDVQKEPLAPFVLALPFADEVLEQQVRRERHAGDVRGEECDLHGLGDLRGGQDRFEHERHADQRQVRDEPRRRLTCTGERQRAERAGQCPERHTAGRDEPAERPLQRERERKHERELHRPEDAVALGSGEHRQRDQRNHDVHKGDGRGDGKIQEEVRDHPDRRERRDHAGGKGQSALADTLVLGVARQSPDRREPLDDADHRR